MGATLSAARSYLDDADVDSNIADSSSSSTWDTPTSWDTPTGASHTHPLSVDPRSPTVTMVRTPIVVENTPMKLKFDPRSPSDSFDRTPLIVDEVLLRKYRQTLQMESPDCRSASETENVTPERKITSFEESMKDLNFGGSTPRRYSLRRSLSNKEKSTPRRDQHRVPEAKLEANIDAKVEVKADLRAPLRVKNTTVQKINSSPMLQIKRRHMHNINRRIISNTLEFPGSPICDKENIQR